MKAEVNQALEIVFSQVHVEALLLDRGALLVGIEPVLCEAPVRAFCHRSRHLLLDLHDVAAGDDAEVNSLGLHLGESFDHILTNRLSWRRQSRVDIE